MDRAIRLWFYKSNTVLIRILTRFVPTGFFCIKTVGYSESRFWLELNINHQDFKLDVSMDGSSGDWIISLHDKDNLLGEFIDFLKTAFPRATYAKEGSRYVWYGATLATPDWKKF